MQIRQRLPIVWVLLLCLLSAIMSGLSLSASELAPELLLPAGLVLFLYILLYLRISINGAGIGFQLSPFIRRAYSWDKIQSAEVIRYSPLLDFGGWGIRYSFRKKAWAYSVRGSWAIRLILKSGRQLYIGLPQAQVESVNQGIAQYQPKI